MNETGNEAGSVTEGLPRTLSGLIAEYKTHKASTFHKLRYHVRQGQANLLRRLDEAHGAEALSGIRASTIQIWYDEWSAGGKVSMAHAFIATLRTLCGFGLLMLEDRECERLSVTMNKLRFPQGESRIAFLTSDHVEAIRKTAREHFGWPSLALAQAFQFECMFRQKDIIGEWVPDTEPGETDVHYHGKKWSRGIRWEEVDDKWILTHKTSKRQKEVKWNLSAAPMVLDELALMIEMPIDQLSRHLFPAKGPIIICDVTGLPWSANEYRRKWRLVADKAGVPKDIRNQDSRAGGITEATEAGADIEHVKHAATHSDISQTQRYSRNSTDKIATVQAKRLQHRFRTAG